MSYDPREQDFILEAFSEMLRAATKDGGRKRALGTKPDWKSDPGHEAAIFSHLSRWKHGEKVDPDSGAHPLVHLAWRALAIAYIETHPLAYAIDPETGLSYPDGCRPVRRTAWGD